ncbi:MAG: 6-bladed beta-propeller [Balneolaceae bacterium]|nr:6-bladed beta-propeller [Balneolaceae bacterium]
MNKIFQWTLITVTLFVFSCNRAEPNTNYNLVFEKHIGNKVYEGFIDGAQSITSDYSNFLYVNDSGQAHVKQYDLDGNFIRNIGKKGQGPGEFPSPLIVTDASDSLLAVNDISGFRISLFDTSGTFISSFPTQKWHSSPSYIVDTTLISRYGGTNYERNLKGEYQFSKFNFGGERISRFVPYPISEETSDFPARGFISRDDVSNGLLHLAYLYIPLYQIYDIESEKLLYEFNLSDFPGFEIAYEQESINGDHPQIIRKIMGELTQVLAYLHVVDNNIFIMRMPTKKIIIEHFKLEKDTLNHVDTYAVSPKSLDGDRVLDFIYIPRKDRFYFMQNHIEEGFVVSVFRHEEQLK